MVVEYDLLMEDPRIQLARLAERLSIPMGAAAQRGIETFASEFLKPDMRHTRFTDADLEQDTRLNPLARDAYRWLRRLATDQVTDENHDLWQDWARIEAQLHASAPLLRHVDYLESELRRDHGGRLQRLTAKLFGR